MCCAGGCGCWPADRTPEQHVQAGDWTALAPPVDGPVGQFCHELAVLAGDRQHELGQAALEAPPAWALAQLGPPPTYDQLAAQVEAGTPVEVGAVDEVAAARVEWAQRAGAVAAYRELRGIADDATSIGAAPSREQEFHRQMWTQAAQALGHAVDAGAVDYRTLPDLDLYAVRDRWTREQAWAPEYVAAEMRTAYELGREYTEDAALAGARLATLEPDDPEWERTAEQLARSEHLADLQPGAGPAARGDPPRPRRLVRDHRGGPDRRRGRPRRTGPPRAARCSGSWSSPSSWSCSTPPTSPSRPSRSTPQRRAGQGA